MVKRAAINRAGRQNWALALAHQVADQTDREFVCELIAFGAIGRQSTGWDRVWLLAIDDKEGCWPNVDVVSVLHTINAKTTPEVEKASELLRDYVSTGEFHVPTLRGKLAGCLNLEDFPAPIPLPDVMKEYGFNPQHLAGSLSGVPFAIRTSCTEAVVGISFGRGSLHSVLLLRSVDSELVSENALANLTMYASFMSQALSTRQMQEATKKSRERLERITGTFGSDAEALALSGGMVIGFAHELKKLYSEISQDTETVLSDTKRPSGWKDFAPDFNS